MNTFETIIAGEALVRSIKEEIALFEECETSNLYQLLTGCDPLLGGVIYLKEKDNDSLLDVIGSISKICNKADSTHDEIELSTHNMIELIDDDDKTIKSSTRFRDCVIGFLEQKIDKLKENVEISSKNAYFEFWEQFQFSEMENNFIQLAIAMDSIEGFSDFFETFFDIISDVEFDDAPDYGDEDYEAWKDSLIKVLSLMLDITPESISEILNGPITDSCVIFKPNFTLNPGVYYLMKTYAENK